MLKFGSVCSGIEAASLAFEPCGMKQIWSSEIAEFPNKVLEHHYPSIPNYGDMTLIPNLLQEGKIQAPDLICGGTPCQAFSLAGWKKGLKDDRGQLTMTFIDIIEEIDKIREKEGKSKSIVLWENVEGVLNDKTNAFGVFLSALAGFDKEIKIGKWSKSGCLEGPKRNIAWRVLDAKYFGLPQQRKRLFVLAGDKNYNPENVLLELDNKDVSKLFSKKSVKKEDERMNLFSENEKFFENVIYKKGYKLEYFREYTDCLYTAYGTKWNGNAAAYNGSLYVAQNDKLRRLSPLECERLMGFPDDYTNIENAKLTPRYQAIGNSWAVPVAKWIGENIVRSLNNDKDKLFGFSNLVNHEKIDQDYKLYMFSKNIRIDNKSYLNTSTIPNTPINYDISEIFEPEGVPPKLYLSSTACKGILRRKESKNIKMNSRLEYLLNLNSRVEEKV